jgi:outer membrane receptor for ferrienterochelin and colicin
MRLMKFWLWFAMALVMTSSLANAQSTNGVISGRVVDQTDLPLPGVTVTVEGPNLQGPRSAVTSANGDYIVPLLPPGSYTVTFELTGFQRKENTVSLAPAQSLPVNATLGAAGISETVEVVGTSTLNPLDGAVIATRIRQADMSNLAVTRDITSIMIMAPGVHPTGPNGNFSVSGAMSFDNLYLVNGVTVNENLRGQAQQNLVIEDAIEETTIATGGVSSEFGRFGGGVINVITKSGGNDFSGSFRLGLANDDWRALVPKREGDPFANDTKVDKTVPTYEYTAGGPIVRDRLWFFTAGRLQKQEQSRQLVITNIPYLFTNKQERFEFKGTYSLNQNHRVQGAYTKVNVAQLNDTFSQAASMDLNSLNDRKLPEDLFTINYTGVLTPTLSIEGRYSARNLTLEGSGAKFTDPIKGTLLVEASGRRYWSATFCGVCSSEERDNQDIFAKANYFLSTSRYGAHAFVVGFDNFDDLRTANNHQSGSDYRFINANAIVQGTDLTPQFISGTTQIQWNPIFVESEGSTFKTLSFFLNDNWRVTDRITANVGIRWDKNDGVGSDGILIADSASFSPRFGIVWDPTGAGEWSVTASAAKYTSGLITSVADQTSPAGNPDQYRFVYDGPSINANPAGPLVPTEEAIARVFAWYAASGGATLPLTTTPSVRGVTPKSPNSLESPGAWEYSGGVARSFGARATLRADATYRKFGNFYAIRTDTTTGLATDTRSFAPPSVQGRVYDLGFIENESSGLLHREYAGVTFQGQYRFGTKADVGASYTLSHLWGNVDGENVGSGPLTDTALQYPEYKRAEWNFPDGDLSADQRHRARLWLTYNLPWGLSLGLTQALESGAPYSASNQNGTFNGVNPQPYVTNPGYRTPPDGAATQYYYTARDAFRLEGQKRTDLAVNYLHRVPGAGRLQLVGQLQVINLFNQFQLCACGGSVFVNGGTVANGNIDTTVRTAVNAAATYQRFNPFTTTPVQGVNWDYGTNFGKALNRFAYTTPRQVRMSFGLRF